MALVTSARLRAISNAKDALDLFNDLGFSASSRPIDVQALGLPGVKTARVIKAGATNERGMRLSRYRPNRRPVRSAPSRELFNARFMSARSVSWGSPGMTVLGRE